MRNLILCMVVYLSIMINSSSADFVQGINIDFVTIGNPGNAADTRLMSDGTTGYGTVDYEYRIGQYEITNDQWNTFVSIAGAPTGNLSAAYDESATYTGASQPTNGISWYEATQFCNYLTSGDKSEGAYLYSGDNDNPGDFLGIDRDSAISTYGVIYALPTENEFYKAAYFKPDGSGYSLYANGTGTIPVAGVDTNYSLVNPEPWEIIIGASNGTEEQNGTYDMMGNIWEWNETLIESHRGLLGGSYLSRRIDFEDQDDRYHRDPTLEISDMGFRVASVPEPATFLLLGLGTVVMVHRRK